MKLPRKSNLHSYIGLFGVTHERGSDDEPLREIWRQGGREVIVNIKFGRISRGIDPNGGVREISLSVKDKDGYGFTATIGENKKWQPGTSDVPSKLEDLTIIYPAIDGTRSIKRKINLSEVTVGAAEVIRTAATMAKGAKWRNQHGGPPVITVPKSLSMAMEAGNAPRFRDVFSSISQINIADEGRPVIARQKPDPDSTPK